MRRALAAGAITAIVVSPTAITEPVSAQQPHAAAPTSFTSTALAAAPPPAFAVFAGPPPARTGMGDAPDAERTTGRTASRAQARKVVRAQARKVVRVARTVVHKKPAYVGKHRPEARKSTPTRKVTHRTVKRAVTSRKAKKSRTTTAARGGMRAVLAFARAQVGKPYVRNAAGPGAYDCSGFTMRAYAKAGIRLPHSSGGQAARARKIPRSQARPGDLVVGDGHVGIYAGGGMMYDAGNSRVDVTYRKMYGGLWIERF